ncbi:MAG: hypothetical protein WDM77_01190 [Steroidobacteraceae bacterium]
MPSNCWGPFRLPWRGVRAASIRSCCSRAPTRAALHQLLAGWLEKIAQLPAARRVRWALDVDPIDLF